nr:MAG TPA: hypothetical protein [Caudoviricetes sp.]DAX95655.1 MAG TPA: hypothetical protein [Caudoviricetes sp.]
MKKSYPQNSKRIYLQLTDFTKLKSSKVEFYKVEKFKS